MTNQVSTYFQTQYFTDSKINTFFGDIVNHQTMFEKLFANALLSGGVLSSGGANAVAITTAMVYINGAYISITGATLSGLSNSTTYHIYANRTGWSASTTQPVPTGVFIQKTATQSGADYLYLGDAVVDISGNVTISGQTAITSGGVAFINSSGQLLSASSKFFWDSTNNRLGLGTTTPASILDINASATDALIIRNAVSNRLIFGYNGLGNWVFNVYLDSGNNGNLLLYDSASNGKVSLETAGPSYIKGGDVMLGVPSVATNATTGFAFIAANGGAPTGAPGETGYVPLYYDTTNNYLYVYNSGWKKTTVFA